MSEFYNSKEIEEKFYKIWEERGYFEVDGNKDIQEKNKFFCIMMPPPNVTGFLHIGHALTFTLQDIMVRYKRMDGFKTLWQPGLDHAGIATQNVVEKELLKQGIKKEDIGKSEFLKKTWEWKEFSGGTILKQLRRLGVSPAWSRERFTMDDGLKNAVKKAFVDLYNKGLIYKGDYMINWCTHDGALSDIEVEYEESNSKLYYLKYPIKDSDKNLLIATTRPETFFGDSAVMVNPNDQRYKDLVGKSVILPLINKEIKIIADEKVEMDFGTGAVKVTPAHDQNDYEVGLRHNLEFIKIFDEKGILNEKCVGFAGLERLKARDEIVKKLDELGFIEKIEDYKNQVGYCYRCKNVVEPYISKQWFIDPKIAKETIKDINEKKANFYPAHWINSFNAWMRELRPWCISRQLWWGHRIPVFYCDSCGSEFASEEDLKKCPKCGKDLRQDENVLDTWFSSALFPFSTLGWGNNGVFENQKYFSDDLANFYPNTMLITGFDILFFWVARMMFMGQEEMGELPFKDIYLHALVKDKFGAKMSKSKGNVIDPLESIEEFSADILRFSLCLLAVQGRDIKLDGELLKIIRNFTNKLYNAHKFLLLNEKSFKDIKDINFKSKVGIFMHSRFNRCVRAVRKNIESYRFNDAANSLYKFLWDEFCDYGIELSKVEKNSISELGAIFKEAMKLLSPFMPFMAEFLYQNLSATSLEENKSIMIMPYPKGEFIDEKAERDMLKTIEAIKSIRRLKATLGIGNSKIELAYIIGEDLRDSKNFIKTLTKCEEIEFIDKKLPKCAVDVANNLSTLIPLNGIDTGEILKRLNSQKNKLEKEILKLSNMLNNEKFISLAPKNVIKENQDALDSAKDRLEKVKSELKIFE